MQGLGCYFVVYGVPLCITVARFVSSGFGDHR